ADTLTRMQEVMGPLPDAKRRVPLDVQITETVETEKFVRKKLTFAAEPGDRVPAYLFLPKGAAGKRPAILSLHQTTKAGKAEPAGLSGRENMHVAKELAER